MMLLALFLCSYQRLIVFWGFLFVRQGSFFLFPRPIRRKEITCFSLCSNQSAPSGKIPRIMGGLGICFGFTRASMWLTVDRINRILPSCAFIAWRKMKRLRKSRLNTTFFLFVPLSSPEDSSEGRLCDVPKQKKKRNIKHLSFFNMQWAEGVFIFLFHFLFLLFCFLSNKCMRELTLNHRFLIYVLYLWAFSEFLY